MKRLALDPCPKNTGHADFIPVSVFSMEHLPGRYQDVAMVNLIKTVSSVTVRLTVRHIDLERTPRWLSSSRGFYSFSGTDKSKDPCSDLKACERPCSDLKKYKYPYSGPKKCKYTYSYLKKCKDPYFDLNENEDPCSDLHEKEDPCSDLNKPRTLNLKKLQKQRSNFTKQKNQFYRQKCYEYPYPRTRLKEYKGSRYGSGYVYNVRRNQEKVCTCRECVMSGVPQEAYCTVYVRTACHVVYDCDEASVTSVDFFYDMGEETAIKHTLYGMYLASCDRGMDQCTLICVTHDREFSENLTQLVNEVSDIFSRRAEILEKKMRGLAVIVSHPHGLAKHVTIGSWSRHFREDCGAASCDSVVFWYDTETCAGSSGAPVLIFDADVPQSRCCVLTHRIRARPGTDRKKLQKYTRMKKFHLLPSITSLFRFEATMDSVSLRVIFPLGAEKECILFIRRTVGQEKERLLREANTTHEAPETFSLLLILTLEHKQFEMNDNLSVKHYAYCLATAESTLKYVTKGQDDSEKVDFWPNLSVNIK